MIIYKMTGMENGMATILYIPQTVLNVENRIVLDVKCSHF